MVALLLVGVWSASEQLQSYARLLSLWRYVLHSDLVAVDPAVTISV